jgi:phosphatidylinositol dimannoside acyltransferase
MSIGLRRRVRLRATYLTYTGLALGLRRLPEPLAQLAAAIVALGMLRRRSAMTVRLRTDHVRRVLRHTTGAEPDPRFVRSMTRQAYLAYARYWVDGARLPLASRQLIYDRWWCEGEDNLAKAMAAGSGVVMALPHVGSWEWGGAWLNDIGFPMTAVAEVLEPPELFEWFIAQRRASGLSIVPMDAHASAEVARTLRSGGLVGLLCDRDLGGGGVEVEFFGERTTFPGGPATLALRTGAKLITTVVYLGPGRSHHAVISPPIDTTRTASLRSDVTRITQEIARHFEDYISRAPEQWHMFQPNWPSDREAEAARGGR